jgi:hypothetical protein
MHGERTMNSLTHDYTYTLYGQQIHSNEPLPLLPAPDHRASTLTLTFLPASARPPLAQATLHYAFPGVNAAREHILQILRLPSEGENPTYCLHIWVEEGWADCLLHGDGRTVHIFDHATLSRDKQVPIVLGLVMSLTLRLQGFTNLHASAVLVDGGVVAFVGVSTAGKSTTLASLLQHGADFFSDDLVPLVIPDAINRDPICSYPGYLRVGLWADAMTALFGPQADLPLLEITDKRIYTPQLAFDPTQPWPLRALYVLAPRGADPALTEVAIVPLAQAEAVAALMPHTTGRMLRDDIGHVNDLARIALLARRVPVRRIDRPNDLSQLDALAQAILRDLQEQPAPLKAH